MSDAETLYKAADVMPAATGETDVLVRPERTVPQLYQILENIAEAYVISLKGHTYASRKELLEFESNYND